MSLNAQWLGMVNYIARQREWSLRTFGEGRRTEGICRHIAKELDEVRESPLDVEEWIDVVILALDGAHRAGHSPEDIVRALCAKQEVILLREYLFPESEDT